MEKNEEILVPEVKENKESRFEFALFVNNNLICKRSFMMYDFIEGSMQTLEFKDTIDEIVRMIDDDLKSKSRVYTWYCFNPMCPSEEFTTPISPDFPVVFKFAIYDNKQEVYVREWDGYGYPRAIRNNVDLTNRVLKLRLKDGTELSFNYDSIKDAKEERIPIDIRIVYEMISDKEDLIPIITKKICETCTSWGESPYESIKDYTTFDTYGDKKYLLNIKQHNNRLFREWGKQIEAKRQAEKK